MADQRIKTEQQLPVIGISMGDINGIGPEIIIETLSDNRITKICTPVIYGSASVLNHYRKLLKTGKFNYVPLSSIDDLHRRKINLVSCLKDGIIPTQGTPSKEGGEAAFLSLKEATNDLKAGKLDGLVTAPIDKGAIQGEEFDFPGHTEFLSSQTGGRESLMLLCNDNLRVGVVTGHIPVSEISKQLTAEKIEKKIALMETALIEDFGISKPKIAVLGLNPHAGDNGLLGKEDDELIRPIVLKLKKDNKLVFGPYPADGFFGNASYTKFDGILAMYHDQGLVPFKTLSFGKGVNFTAGLPIIRTSPDHGTAYDIAGKGKASPDSFRQAIFMACDIVKQRRNLVIANQ